MKNSPIHLIYAGGTFGCHGTPLSALPCNIFLPAFTKLCQEHNYSLHIIDNSIVKDSSTLTPDDLLHFYQTIINHYKQGIDKFLLITGTDTLAYLGAFLAIGLQGLPLTLVITGSMLPLFKPTAEPLTTDTDSDAWANLSQGLSFFHKHIYGCFISFYNEIYHAHSVQKIHKTDKNAFSGTPFSQPYPQLSCPNTSQPNMTFSQIHGFYCTPNSPDILADYLEYLSNKTPTAVIVQGFGAGNMPSSDRLIKAINELDKQGFLLIMASSAIYGQISTAYQAGAWQYSHGFVSAQHLPIPAIYAYALWLCLTLPVAERKQVWQATMTATPKVTP